jgi:hypothetical protein
VTDAFVEARDTNGRGNSTGANSTAGVYDVIVPAGTYTVKANNPRLGSIGSQASVAVTGGQITAVSFTPSSTYAVSGTVASTDTACIAGAMIALTDQTNARFISAQAGADGTWSITAVPNGIYSIIANKPGCVDA